MIKAGGKFHIYLVEFEKKTKIALAFYVQMMKDFIILLFDSGPFNFGFNRSLIESICFREKKKLSKILLTEVFFWLSLHIQRFFSLNRLFPFIFNYLLKIIKNDFYAYTKLVITGI